MNSLHLGTDGHTPESKFYGVIIENILMKTFHNVLSMLRSGQQTLQWGFNWTAEMGTKIKHSCVSWTLSISHQKCCTFLQPIHWTYSPQYRIVFDDDFTNGTMYGSRNDPTTLVRSSTLLFRIGQQACFKFSSSLAGFNWSRQH
jgi:hypothetical protein